MTQKKTDYLNKYDSMIPILLKHTTYNYISTGFFFKSKKSDHQLPEKPLRLMAATIQLHRIKTEDRQRCHVALVPGGETRWNIRWEPLKNNTKKGRETAE